MKMRGYSALFVCALCVFVFCGAAVAQDETPEKKAAEEAKAIAATAKEKANEVLDIHKEFASDVSSVMSNLTLIVDNITASKIQAGKIKLTEGRKRVQVLQKIDRLKAKAEAAVEALRDPEAATLKDEHTKAALTNKMKEVDELYMAVMEKAATAVTGNVSTIDAVIEKAGALETAAREASGLWYDASRDYDGQFDNAMAAVSAVYTAIAATEGFLNLFDGSSDPEAQKVNKELFDAVENILKPSLEKLISLRDEAEKAAESALYTLDQYDELEEKAKNLKEAAKGWKQKAADVKAVEVVGAAKAMADTAKAKGDKALAKHKNFLSDVSSVVSSLVLGVEKITVLKIPADKMVQEIRDIKKEQMLREINKVKAKAGVAKSAVEALKDVEAETLKDEQTKAALTNRMKEVELYMTEVEKKVAAAVAGNISAIDAVVEKAGALETAAKKASGLGHLSSWNSYRQFFENRKVFSSVFTTITATEGFLNLFDGSSDPEALNLKKELSDIIESILTPSLQKLLLFLQYVSQQAKMATGEAKDQYMALEEKAKKLKETAKEWKLRTADVKAVEAAKAMADTAKAKGDEALDIDKEFGSVVSGVMPRLTLAVGKITASKIPAGKIMQELRDIKKERILLEIDKVKAKAEVAKTAVEALKDGEAWTLKDEQTKTALTNRMKEVELYMTEVEKAEAAVAGDISAIKAVIEKAGALETAAEAAGYLWYDVLYYLDARLSSAIVAVRAVNRTITATEGFLDFFNGSSDPEAQKVKKELLDIIENILKPSFEKLMSLQNASERAKKAARETSDQYYELEEKAGKLKETAGDWKLRTANVKTVEAAKAMADTAKAKGDEALVIHEGFVSVVFSVVSSLTLAVQKITASKIPAGKIAQEIKDLKKEQMLREIDGLITKAEAGKTAVERLKDIKAWTFKVEQTKTALTNRMKEEDELYMTVMEKAAAAVTGNIFTIDAVIEKAGALETAAREASGLWLSAMSGFDRQFDNAMAAVSATITLKDEMESAVAKLGSNEDPEAQKVSKELFDAVKNILKPSLERLISLRDASQKAAESARTASIQYYELQEKAGMLKEAAEDWRRDVRKVPQEGGQVSQDPPPSAAN